MVTAPTGEVDRTDIAFLTDRVLVKKGLHQRYGTQFTENPNTGELEPYELEDPENVNVRRKSYGFETTFGEYVAEHMKQVVGTKKEKAE